MRIKICGITQPEQAKAIAQLGATALGFICVPTSPRYVTLEQIQTIVASLPTPLDKIGVFADSTLEQIVEVVTQTDLTGVQLHGNESTEFCDRLGQILPKVERIKAIRVKTPEALHQACHYIPHVETLLLDAYHPHQLGGTGQTLDWTSLQQFRPNCPWFLAGGLNPDNIRDALNLVQPNGIDLSSGVECSPGDKDLAKVTQLFQVLSTIKI